MKYQAYLVDKGQVSITLPFNKLLSGFWWGISWGCNYPCVQAKLSNCWPQILGESITSHIGLRFMFRDNLTGIFVIKNSVNLNSLIHSMNEWSHVQFIYCDVIHLMVIRVGITKSPFVPIFLSELTLKVTNCNRPVWQLMLDHCQAVCLHH